MKNIHHRPTVDVMLPTTFLCISLYENSDLVVDRLLMPSLTDSEPYKEMYDKGL